MLFLAKHFLPVKDRYANSFLKCFYYQFPFLKKLVLQLPVREQLSKLMSRSSEVQAQ